MSTQYTLETFDVGIGGWIAMIRDGHGEGLLTTGECEVVYYESMAVRQLAQEALERRPDLLPAVIAAVRDKYNMTEEKARDFCGIP